MSYDVSKEVMQQTFAVPVCITDEHIRIAGGDQLKVLLWILRNSPENPDINRMCADLKMKPDDAKDYLHYWVMTKVLSPGNAVSPAPEASTAPAAQPQSVAAPQVRTINAEALPVSKPSSAEILVRIEESPEIGKLFAEAQKILGKTIGYDGQCTLLLIHDHFGLPVEVIFTLIGYCVSVNKINYSYIEAVGKDWGEREIDTFEKAQQQVASLTRVNLFWKRFCAMTGITNPRPTLTQTAYISRWLDEFKFSDDMISLAYEEMANHTQRFSIGYINKVLTNWFTKGLRSPADVAREQQEHAAAKSRTAAGTTASYDIDEFERRSAAGKLKYERKKPQ